LPAEPVECLKLAFISLYRETDNINIVCKFSMLDEKARPFGAGRVMSRDQWVEYFDSHGVPQSEAGGWMRINPCAPCGSGKDGAVTDDDVAAYRFVLLESDSVPLPLQLALLTRLRLPVAAILLSGSQSAHAWVRVEASGEKRFGEIAKRLFAALKPFGIDQANSNPSRLSRLPGAVRVIGATGDGLQRLLWLNPTVKPLTVEDLKQFEESLTWPAIEEKPLRAVALSSMTRWQELFENQGKLGVPYGIKALDDITGGIKAGQTVVIAGATGGGKSTYALHLVKAALKASYGVALFSLEMDREEVFDLIVSDHCSIDRNKFNNGKFSKDFDFPRMAEEMPKLIKLPLYIEDNATVGVEDIRTRVMQLKADGKIHLAVVDYIQFIDSLPSKDSREQQVAAISHALRKTARESRVPFVVLSQLNDDGKLRESRVIAHNANVVLLITVDGDDVKVSVKKGRGIPYGDYHLHFNRMFARLEEKS
jgi:RecA/RadA recombinase